MHRRVQFLVTSRPWHFRCGALICVAWVAVGHGQTTDQLFRNATFEELANITVMTVSKRDEPLSHVSAALTVVTAEDIQRSGAASIPEAMRYVPGLEVAQINSHDWAVSARGFNSRFANKQLVLEDGRTLYSPFSGGVYWEAVGPPVAEIEQIEIIRGPGASLWGANAMNGVINIITRSSRNNQGGTLSVGAGSLDNRSVYAGYGFQTGERTWARVYGEGIHAGSAKLPNGNPADDSWQVFRGGLRVDHDFSETSQLMLQGEFSSARLDESAEYPQLTPPYRARVSEPSRMEQAHLLARWTSEPAPESKLTVHAFWSHEKRTQFRNDFRNDTIDLELTHQLPAGEKQQLVWGGGLRLVRHELLGKVGAAFPDTQPKDEIVNIFLQDEIQLVPDRLSLTIGTKLERNNVTEFEYEPSVRALWRPTKPQTWWAAVSRTVHTPSVLERSILYDAVVSPGPPLTLVRQISAGNNESEVQIAYELGYRYQPAADVSLDATVFYNDLPKVQAFRQGQPFFETLPAPAHYVVPLIFDKTGLQGSSGGVELALRWQPAAHWRLSAAYSYLDVNLNTRPGLTTFATMSPRHQVRLRSSCELAQHWQLDLGLRYTSARPGSTVEDHLMADAQLVWRPDDRWEIAIIGQSLLDRQHAEIPPFGLGATVEIPTMVSGRITWRFP